MKRFKDWIGILEIGKPRKVKYSEAIDNAIENGVWRGLSLLIYEFNNKTIFEDMTGSLSEVTAMKWLEFALNDEMEFIGYNDAVPYGQIIIIRNGTIQKDFFHDEQISKENRNIGKYEFEEKHDLKTWSDAASYVDSVWDQITIPEEGELWIFKK